MQGLPGHEQAFTHLSPLLSQLLSWSALQSVFIDETHLTLGVSSVQEKDSSIAGRNWGASQGSPPPHCQDAEQPWTALTREVCVRHQEKPWR